tara:strand:- start:11 stop:136 length:126 start_codon:yes stop_codon:yes gene_type:complete
MFGNGELASLGTGSIDILIGRIKDGMNTTLHAVTDANDPAP